MTRGFSAVPTLHRPIPDGPLAQGEILTGLIQYVAHIRDPAQDDRSIEFTAIEHGHALILTQMCDLQQDFKARFGAQRQLQNSDEFISKPQKYLLEAVLLCKADRESTFRELSRGVNRDVFRNAESNAHERYHCLGPLRRDDDDESYVSGQQTTFYR